MSATAILALASLLGAPAPDTTGNTDPKLAQLVHQLGAKSYRAREDAARNLLKRGAGAVAALSDGIKDIDPEVSERCRQLLPQAAALDRNEKLAALTKDPSVPPPKGLAGLERFLKITGDNKGSRELYAELLSIHHRTLEAAEEDPKKATEQFRQFCDDAYNKWRAGINAGRYSYDTMFATRADITFFLFVAADARIRKNNAAVGNASILLNGNQINNAISEKDGTPAMRKIFLDWLENETQVNFQQRGFAIAALADLKEARPIALKLLERKEQQSYGKAQILIALLKLGTKEDIAKLVPLMEDKTVITTVNFGNGKPLTVQIRDVAMGVALQLGGQKPVDFGFDNRFAAGASTSYLYYGFPDDKTRDEAISKWKEWIAKNPKK